MTVTELEQAQENGSGTLKKIGRPTKTKLEEAVAAEHAVKAHRSRAKELRKKATIVAEQVLAKAERLAAHQDRLAEEAEARRKELIRQAR